MIVSVLPGRGREPLVLFVDPGQVLAGTASASTLVLVREGTRPAGADGSFAVPAFIDRHVIADLDNPRHAPWLEMADVLVSALGVQPVSPAERLTSILRRFPGCLVAAVTDGRTFQAGSQDGQFLKITRNAPVDEPSRSAAELTNVTLASSLHCLQVMGRRWDEVGALVIYGGPPREGPGLRSSGREIATYERTGQRIVFPPSPRCGPI
jgi:acarbose 7IV-phosphotransferase